jgi:hypothetical protein
VNPIGLYFKSHLQGLIRVWSVVDEIDDVNIELNQALVIGTVEVSANSVIQIFGCDIVKVTLESFH